MGCVVTKCCPPENRDPTDARLANCRPDFVGEIGTRQPAAVLTTGKHATKGALDDESLNGFLYSVLDPLRSAAVNVPVVPLLHVVSRSLAPRQGYSYVGYTAAVSDTITGVGDT